MEIDIKELYGVRTLVFIEVGSQSNKYKQVILSPEQFKKVSDAIVTVIGQKDNNGLEDCLIALGDKEYTLPDLSQSTCNV